MLKRIALILVLAFGVAPAGAQFAAPGEADRLFALGYEALRTGRFAEAVGMFDSGLAQRPNDASARFYLAESLYSLGDYARARVEYGNSLTFDPNSPVAPHARQRLAAMGGQPGVAPGPMPQQTGCAGYARANFARRDLRGANFARCDLREANFEGAILDNANLENAQLDGAFFAGASLANASMTRVSARSAVFTGANLSNAVLQSADLQGARLDGAIMERADLQLANLQNAILVGANLTRAEVKRADLRGADVYRVTWYRANVRQADLRRVRNLDNENFRFAEGDREVRR